MNEHSAPIRPWGGPPTEREYAAIDEAFTLALRGPKPNPNPQVGCVLLSPSGTVIGTGWHKGAGTPHAEVVALKDAATRGHTVVGATAVVTLEPCNHTGRTGPCAVALMEAGIGRVVYCAKDPGGKSSGGAARLTAAGVDVFGGVEIDRAARLLADWYFAEIAPSSEASAGSARDHGSLQSAMTPKCEVVLKIASSLDGRINAADGTSQWITGPESRAHAHEQRAASDAILVGTATVFADNPTLTARRSDGGLFEHQPTRVVMGMRDVPDDANLRGVGTALVHVRTHDPQDVLFELTHRGVRRVIVEGGPTVASAFMKAGLVDELHSYIAPIVLGSGRSSVDDVGVGTIADARAFDPLEVTRLGSDVFVRATPARSPRSGREAP